MTLCFLDNVLHLFQLSLSSGVSTQSLLGELSGSLLTRVSDQLNDSSFVWRQTSDLTDQLSNKVSSLADSDSLLWSNGLWGDLVSLVSTYCNT